MEGVGAVVLVQGIVTSVEKSLFNEENGDKNPANYFFSSKATFL
jgi:hypothetical protein